MENYDRKGWEDDYKWDQIDHCRICKATKRDANLRICHYCDFTDDATYLCDPCYEEEYRGKCESRPPTPDWDGSMMAGNRCKRQAVYQNPPCCGRGWYCDICYDDGGCPHRNHDTYLQWIEIEGPGKRACRYCYEFEERRQQQLQKERIDRELREQREWMEKRDVQEDLELVNECDDWADEHVNFEKMAGFRDVCLV